MTRPTNPPPSGRGYLSKGPVRDDVALAVFSLIRIRGRTQAQAAEALGLSRSKVQRLLVEAESDLADAEALARFRR